MWNALAGYGGLVSVGQQAFIGFGAYAAIFLTPARPEPVPRRCARRAVGGRDRARRSPLLVLRLRGGAVRDRDLGGRRGRRAARHRSTSLGGGTGTLAARRSTSTRRGPRRLHVLDRARPSPCCSSLLVRAAAQPHSVARCRRSATTRRPRPRSASACCRASGMLFVLAGVGLRRGRRDLIAWQNTLFRRPQSIFGVNWTART